MTENDPGKSFDDAIVFAAESGQDRKTQPNLPPWKLLVVDDEQEIHNMTKMVLSGYKYNGAELEFFHAYSGSQAKGLILEHPDCACVLLDVVMETYHAGLDVAKFIRQEAKNATTRIILRTGQPGKAPEKSIILEYDINDYKEKTELTSQKLFTTITTAIRSFEHLTHLEKQKKEIADKNIRLNKEIARRIVAESNLAKYNKSLEQTIDDKKKKLENALIVLKNLEQDLKKSRDQQFIKDLSSEAIPRIDLPAKRIMESLTLIDGYSADMGELIRKHDSLLQIIDRSKALQETEETRKHTGEIQDFKKITNMDKIIEQYPVIIKNAIQDIDSIAKTASGIKQFIKISNGQPKPLDLKTTLEKIITVFFAKSKKKATPGKNIDLHTDLNEVPTIKASYPGLIHTFKALLKNAFEAIETQGIVSISLYLENEFILITISDTGKGISPQDLPKVFDPYFSSNKQKAKGLGLFLAKSVVTGHRGTIEIESSQGEGTTVTIRLPLDIIS